MHQQNRYAIHRLLARITDYVETQSGTIALPRLRRATGATATRSSTSGRINPERHVDEFAHPADFAEYRNRIGDLLLLPKSFNASYGDLPYEEKLPHYNSQNLLARSLHESSYDHNPGFVRFVSKSGLPFDAHNEFKKADQDQRSVLYRSIAERIWNPDDLLMPYPKR